MSTKKTRANTSFPVTGHGQELCETVLPTYEDVLKYYLLLQNKIERESGGKHPSISEIVETVATRVERIWHKASIPIVSHIRILQKIKQYHDKYRGIIKHLKQRQKNASCKVPMKKFQDQAKQLFDLAVSKCE